ncbi:glutamate-5-semialdehyde dehydrogenase [Terrimonas rubra]|uniref:Gamma-glutamyl phosphate reductase n=1 Tax=Terrimonas rubra TaxID=1035890 RepID=A0ABW6A6Z7_9BACT
MLSITKTIIKTRQASIALQAATDKQIKKTLNDLAAALLQHSVAILRANAKDVAKQDAANPRTDRLLLTPARIKAISDSIKKVSRLPMPGGKSLDRRVLKNGLKLQRITTPLGVVAAIYESRPNVTYDIAALCLRSGNACLLKGSSEADNSNKAAIKIIKQVLTDNGLPADAVNLLPSARETVNHLFTATKYIDVIIPRGSNGLIEYVRKNSLVPVIETGAGVCHVYVHEAADLEMAANIVVNAKTSRPSVCNAMDTVIVDRSVAAEFLDILAPGLKEKGVIAYADKTAYAVLKNKLTVYKATAKHYATEFLSLHCAVKTVSGIEEALKHIQTYSTRHSEAIVTSDKKLAQQFLRTVDAAAVYHNASTRFTDGEEFGLGAEVGISTQKLHARGPFALEKLVTEKWIVEGRGQVR